MFPYFSTTLFMNFEKPCESKTEGKGYDGTVFSHRFINNSFDSWQWMVNCTASSTKKRSYWALSGTFLQNIFNKSFVFFITQWKTVSVCVLWLDPSPEITSQLRPCTFLWKPRVALMFSFICQKKLFSFIYLSYGFYIPNPRSLGW